MSLLCAVMVFGFFVFLLRSFSSFLIRSLINSCFFLFFDTISLSLSFCSPYYLALPFASARSAPLRSHASPHSSADASRLLKKSSYSIERACELFFTDAIAQKNAAGAADGEGSTGSGGAGEAAKKVGEIWERYKGASIFKTFFSRFRSILRFYLVPCHILPRLHILYSHASPSVLVDMQF